MTHVPVLLVLSVLSVVLPALLALVGVLEQINTYTALPSTD